MEAFPLDLCASALDLLAQDHRSKVCVFINELVGTHNGSDCPTITSLSVLTWQDLYSSHESETAPYDSVQC